MRAKALLMALAQVAPLLLVLPSNAWADESTVVREFSDAAGRHVVLRQGR